MNSEDKENSKMDWKTILLCTILGGGAFGGGSAFFKPQKTTVNVTGSDSVRRIDTLAIRQGYLIEKVNAVEAQGKENFEKLNGWLTIVEKKQDSTLIELRLLNKKR